MAEMLLIRLAGDVIGKLSSEALQRIGLWWGVKDEIEKLRNTVSTIQAVLLDAEERQAGDHQIKDWLGKLKEVLYDADDLLDDWATDALHRQVMVGNELTKEVRLFFSRSNQLAYGYRMGQKVKAIREKLDDIANDSQKLNLVRRLITEKPLKSGDRETHSYAEEGEVIGRERDKMAILDALTSDSSTSDNILIIPIVGIGGVGKTALAQLVFRDKKVKDRFKQKMWVCVSDAFDVKVIVKNIVKSATEGEIPNLDNLELDQLQNQLQKEIDGKRYLLVLDDIWNEDPNKWIELEKLLSCGARGSRIIVTTRSQKVAKVTSKRMLPHVLKGLSSEDSWSLFTRRVGEGQKLDNSKVRETGHKILEKCSGVPLAINTIARLLYFKDPETEWSSFMEEEFSTIPQDENLIMQTLQLSYNHLPSHLKHCFAYCSLFPKDHRIEVETLIRLWIAQGYVSSSNPSRSLEEVGLGYFKDLLWRCFFQDVWYNYYVEKTFSCKMHDLMHDLATLAAGSETSVVSSPNAQKIGERLRHASLNNNVDWQLLSAQLLTAKGLRTFLLTHQTYNLVKLRANNVEAIFSNFKHLRVLDLQRTGIKEVPASIKKLKHLRYLDLSRALIEELPDSVARLQNLQVLRLLGCFNLRELPEDITKLVNLRHLDVTGCYNLTHMPRGIGQLTSLQTLTYFVVGEAGSASKHTSSSNLSELGRLKNLRGRLEIVNLQHIKENHRLELKEKHNLESLILSWRTHRVIERHLPHPKLKGLGIGANIPSWFSSLTKFRGSPRIGNRHRLKEKHKREDPDCDEVPLESHQPHPNLEALESLQPHPNLQQLRIDCYDGANIPSWFSSLTNLVRLTLLDCGRCKHLPPLHQITSLKYLTFEGLPELEYIDNDGATTRFTGGEGSTFFPSLEELTLRRCENLKGWWKKSDNNDDDDTTTTIMAELPRFPRLWWLEINHCPKLTLLPLLPPLDRLVLYGTIGILLQTVRMKMAITTSPPVLPLSKLKYLTLGEDEDLESLPEEWLQNLTSLTNLDIVGCPNLKSLPLGRLTSLRSLYIEGSPHLTDRCGKKEGADWPTIAHIQRIEIDNQIIQEEEDDEEEIVSHHL